MKLNRLPLFIYLFLAVLCFSCTNKQSEKQDTDQLNTAITDLDNAWNNMDVEKIVGLFAENGTYLVEDKEMLRGREAIRNYLTAGPKAEKFEFNRDKVEVRMVDSIAYEIVNQTITYNMKDEEPQTILNKYIHIWEKQKDGSWRILIDMVNRRTPPGE